MFILEVGTLQNVKMPYTYTRRAQSTLQQMKWKQIFMCEEKQPLIDWAKNNPASRFGSSAKYRIEGIGKHASEGIIAMVQGAQDE